MKIACLAWGSLLWKTGPLILASPWWRQGPSLSVEFCRVADGGELSTALCDAVPPQPIWWALLATDDLATAREQLRQREQIDPERADGVGTLPWAGPPFPHADAIEAWRLDAGVDAVVWTALPPRIGGVEGRMPSPEEAVSYLLGLEGETLAHAQTYVRRIPGSMTTPIRSAIEARLGWTPAAVDERDAASGSGGHG